MSVQILSTYICPKCDEGITTDKQPPFKCDGCGYPIGPLDVPQYDYPLTLAEQHIKYKDDLRFYRAVVDMDIEQANYVMQDALNIVQTLAGKNVHISDIRNLIEMATDIGNIAKAYNEFLVQKGQHVPSLFKELEKAETTKQKQETEQSKEKKNAEPQPLWHTPADESSYDEYDSE